MLTSFNDRLKNNQDFRLAILDAGLPSPEEIIDDGQIHRFSTNDKKGNKDGWYILYSDGIPNGLFGCWRTSIALRKTDN
jgi:putative DNA primase/helicase